MSHLFIEYIGDTTFIIQANRLKKFLYCADQWPRSAGPACTQKQNQTTPVQPQPTAHHRLGKRSTNDKEQFNSKIENTNVDRAAHEALETVPEHF